MADKPQEMPGIQKLRAETTKEVTASELIAELDAECSELRDLKDWGFDVDQFIHDEVESIREAAKTAKLNQVKSKIREKLGVPPLYIPIQPRLNTFQEKIDNLSLHLKKPPHISHTGLKWAREHNHRRVVNFRVFNQDSDENNGYEYVKTNASNYINVLYRRESQVRGHFEDMNALPDGVLPYEERKIVQMHLDEGYFLPYSPYSVVRADGIYQLLHKGTKSNATYCCECDVYADKDVKRARKLPNIVEIA